MLLLRATSLADNDEAARSPARLARLFVANRLIETILCELLLVVLGCRRLPLAARHVARAACRLPLAAAAAAAARSYAALASPKVKLTFELDKFGLLQLGKAHAEFQETVIEQVEEKVPVNKTNSTADDDADADAADGEAADADAADADAAADSKKNGADEEDSGGDDDDADDDADDDEDGDDKKAADAKADKKTKDGKKKKEKKTQE